MGNQTSSALETPLHELPAGSSPVPPHVVGEAILPQTARMSIDLSNLRPSIDGGSRPSMDLSRPSVDLVPAVQAELRTLTKDHVELLPPTSTPSVPEVESVETGHGPIIKQGPLPAIANLLNCILAAGAVGGPYALASAGLPLGLLAYIGVAFLMDYSLVLLVSTAISSKILDYQQMCKLSMGWPGYVVLSIVQFGQGYGCMVCYLMVAADTFGSLLALIFSIVGHANVPPLVLTVVLDRRIIIFAIVIAIILPISFLKNITSLARTSYLSIVSVLFIACAVLTRWVAGVPYDVSDEVPEPCYVFSHVSFMEGLGIAAFSFVTHHESLLLYKGLEDGRQRNWANVTHYSMLISCLCLLVIAIPGYLTFFDTTEDNILNNYPNNDPLITAARLTFGLTMVLTYPLEHFVSRSVFLDLVRLVVKRGSENLKFVLATLFLVGSSTVIAMFVSDLGAVLTLTGGVCASTLAYIMPGLLYLRLEKHKTLPNKIASVALIVIGGSLCFFCPAWVIYRIVVGE